jgi:hypothetical protein
MVITSQVKKITKPYLFSERILHVHLLGDEDEEARKEITLLNRMIRNNVVRILHVSSDTLILKVHLMRKDEKKILNLAKRFSRILVWVEW